MWLCKLNVWLCFHCNQIRKMKMPGRENRTAVVVGTVTDDVRIQDLPKLKVTCLFFRMVGVSLKAIIQSIKDSLATLLLAFSEMVLIIFLLSHRSAPWELPMVPATGSWRQAVRSWPLTSWLWLLLKDRAPCCCQVTKHVDSYSHDFLNYTLAGCSCFNKTTTW